MKGERATTWNKLRNSVAIVPRPQNMSSKISAFLEKESWSHKAQMRGPSRQMAWRRNRRKKQGETAGKGTKPHDSAALETLARPARRDVPRLLCRGLRALSRADFRGYRRDAVQRRTQARARLLPAQKSLTCVSSFTFPAHLAKNRTRRTLLAQKALAEYQTAGHD